MDARTFLGLEQSHNPFRWASRSSATLSTSGGFLFGGCGLARRSRHGGHQRAPLVWATAQYLSYAKPGEVLDIDVTLAVEGHQITQARAVCHVGNREILTVNAALGDRPGWPSGQFETMPDVAASGRAIRERCIARPATARSTIGSSSGWSRAATARTSTAPTATARR